MVVFKRLSLTNFKGFAGSQDISLAGDGQMTVFAAQNGVGKTTLMDSIHIALYGKRGFKARYPGVGFEEWLENAYSIEAPESEFREMRFAIEMECPIRGTVRISRQFWLLDRVEGGLSGEFGVTIDGKPLELEPGEKRADVSERWVEAFLPHSVMKRFLVDGERLTDLDTRAVDEALIDGIDDLLGIGIYDRMNKHLHSLQGETLRRMAPDGQKAKMDDMMELSVTFEEEITQLDRQIAENEITLLETQNRIEELNDAIQLSSRAEGDEDNALRIEWATRHSELTSIRRELLEHSNTTLPFLLAGLPKNLDRWNVVAVRKMLEEQKRSGENIRFIGQVLDEMSPPPGAQVRKRIETTANQVASQRDTSKIDSPVSSFGLHQIDQIERRHIEVNLDERVPILENALETAVARLDRFEEVEARLRKASEGLGITEMANELKDQAMVLGGLQANLTHLVELKGKKEEGLTQIDEQIEAIKGRSDKESFLNRKVASILDLRQVLHKVARRERELVAAPLAIEFHEGFRLLSRKADRIESVSIDPSTYKTTIQMRGFEGNWLDRDLSATEKQHVGLSLLYALRKVGNRAYPVIIDTPTSRMDRDHKGWSVTRFYPALSHQVIVLATSDDLGDGLYDELASTGALGREMHIEEKTENSVMVTEVNLATFFGA